MEPQDIQKLFTDFQDSSARYSEIARQVTNFVVPDVSYAQYVSATTANDALAKYKEFKRLHEELEVAEADMQNTINLLVKDLDVLRTKVVVFDFESQRDVHIWSHDGLLKYQKQ